MTASVRSSETRIEPHARRERPPRGGSSTPTIDPAKIEPLLVKKLARDVGVSPTGVKMRCPSGVPAKKSTRFQCKLIATDGSTAKVRVTVTSVTTANGEIHYTVHAVVPKRQFK